MKKLKLLCIAFMLTLLLTPAVSTLAEEITEVPTVEAVAAHEWRYGFYCRDVPDDYSVEYCIYNTSNKKWMVKSNIRSGAGCLEYATGKSLPSGIVYCKARFINESENTVGKWCEPVYEMTQAKVSAKYTQSNLQQHKVKLKWKKVPGAKRYLVYVGDLPNMTCVRKCKGTQCTLTSKSVRGLNVTDAKPLRVAIVAVGKRIKSNIEFVDTFYLD